MLQIIIQFIRENLHKYVFTGVELLNLYGGNTTWNKTRDMVFRCDYSLLDSICSMISEFGIDFEISKIFDEVCGCYYTANGQQASLLPGLTHESKFTRQ